MSWRAATDITASAWEEGILRLRNLESIGTPWQVRSLAANPSDRNGGAEADPCVFLNDAADQPGKCLFGVRLKPG